MAMHMRAPFYRSSRKHSSSAGDSSSAVAAVVSEGEAPQEHHLQDSRSDIVRRPSTLRGGQLDLQVLAPHLSLYARTQQELSGKTIYGNVLCKHRGALRRKHGG